MADRKKPLRWRREPRETGLRSVCQGERGWELRRGGERLASVSVQTRGWSKEKIGYYFSGRIGNVFINTAAEGRAPFPDSESAKREAEKWVKDQIMGNPNA